MELEIFNKNLLLQDLKRFGLNPTEWQLSKGLSGKDQPQLITHKEDESFCFLGFPGKALQRLHWKELQLLSI